MSQREIFVSDLKACLQTKKPFRIILSKPRNNASFISTCIECLEDEKFKILEKTSTQHFTKVIDSKNLEAYIIDNLENGFYFAELTTEKFCGNVLQNKKGTFSYIKKNSSTSSISVAKHNKEKAYLIPEDAPFLKKLNLSSDNGKVYEKAFKKYRQINKFIEIIDAQIPNDLNQLTISDMGSGKAYLTFATYYFFKIIRKIDVKIIGYELRQELVDHCNQVASELQYQELKFVQANIIEAEIENADMIISLHACDIATDMAIHAGIKSNSKYFLLAPCCHKQIRKAMTLKNGITRHGILLERQAEIITDAIRALILEDLGYKTKVFEFINSEHTAKNLMIQASKSEINKEAAFEISKLKSDFGIDHHYLETLLKKSY
jgi:hypothetical protein